MLPRKKKKGQRALQMRARRPSRRREKLRVAVAPNAVALPLLLEKAPKSGPPNAEEAIALLMLMLSARGSKSSKYAPLSAAVGAGGGQ